jgi:hypothetical protein
MAGPRYTVLHGRYRIHRADNPLMGPQPDGDTGSNPVICNYFNHCRDFSTGSVRIRCHQPHDLCGFLGVPAFGFVVVLRTPKHVELHAATAGLGEAFDKLAGIIGAEESS